MVLYRKYRPTSFKEIIGVDHIKSVLVSSIKLEQVFSGYLFSGPRGTGKTSLARIFAKAINCENFHQEDDVCNSCTSCVSINEFYSTDVIEIDAASNRGVDDIKNLKESVNYLPNRSKYKVYIIDEVHMLTSVAFNTFLKTLEEPPKNVVFILATTEPSKIPATILSRVQRYDLQLQTEEKIIQKLKYIVSSEKKSYPDFVLKKIFRMTGGSFRDAESLLAKILAAEVDVYNEEVVNRLLGVSDTDIVENFINILLDSTKNGLSNEILTRLESLILMSGNFIDLLDESASHLNQMLMDSAIDLETYVILSKILLEIKMNARFVKKTSLVNLVILCIKNQIDQSQSHSFVLNNEKKLQNEQQLLSKSDKNKFQFNNDDNQDKLVPPQLPPILKSIVDKAKLREEGNILYIYVKDKKYLSELTKPRNLSIMGSVYNKEIKIVGDFNLGSEIEEEFSLTGWDEINKNEVNQKRNLNKALDDLGTDDLDLQPMSVDSKVSNKNIVEKIF